MMLDIDQYLPVFDDAYQQSEQNTNLALKAIKEKGGSAITAILVLKRQLGLSTAEADEVVLDSEIWDTRGSLSLRNALFDAFNELDEKLP